MVFVSLHSIGLACNDRQHFLCVIEMNGQGFKWKSLGLVRRATAFTARCDVHQPLLVLLTELQEKGVPLPAWDLAPSSRVSRFCDTPHGCSIETMSQPSSRHMSSRCRGKLRCVSEPGRLSYETLGRGGDGPLSCFLLSSVFRYHMLRRQQLAGQNCSHLSKPLRH